MVMLLAALRAAKVDAALRAAGVSGAVRAAAIREAFC
jgi:hypothetical protein